MGSGCLLDTTQFGLSPEPTVQESIAAGVGLAFFSGDKLLGGPQAGIIVGKKVYIDKLKKHPLVRALRIDKNRIAGLAATLLHYLKGEALTEVPVWRMISMPLNEIDKRAGIWAASIGKLARVIDGESLVGGGSLPGATLPTRLVAIGDVKKPGLAQKVAHYLRLQETPIIGRISDNILLLDPRTVPPQRMRRGERTEESGRKALIKTVRKLALESHIPRPGLGQFLIWSQHFVCYRYCRSCRPW